MKTLGVCMPRCTLVIVLFSLIPSNFLFQIIGVDHVFFIQKNSVDWRKRTLTINAYNESYSSRVMIKENCYYSVSTVEPTNQFTG